MTREELVALFEQVLKWRIWPVEVSTLLLAVDKYVDNQVRIAREASDASA